MCLNIGMRPEIRKETDSITQEPYDVWSKWMPEEIYVIGPPGTDNDCESFALGRTGIMEFLPYAFPEVPEPREGDVVLYIGEKPVHVGRYHDGLVISKWGRYGPVMSHPVDCVPTCYGNRVAFFRIPESELQNFRRK